MNKKLTILGATAIISLGIIVFGSSQTLAYQGDYSKVGPNHTEERAALMQEVMENKDYEGWKKLMTENGRTPGVLRKIDTQEEFNQFAEAYELGKAGKTDEASKIRAELGLGGGLRNGNGKGNCN